MDLLQLLTMLAATLPVKTNVAGMTANVPIAEANMAGPRSQAFAGGNTNPSTLLLALQLMQENNKDINRFTGFNDDYHTRGQHVSGLAGDVTLANSERSDEVESVLRNLLEGRGLTRGKDYGVLNEYKKDSKYKTAPHLHYEFKSPEAAQRFLENSFIELDKDYNIKNPVESQRKYADFMQKVYGKK